MGPVQRAYRKHEQFKGLGLASSESAESLLAAEGRYP